MLLVPTLWLALCISIAGIIQGLTGFGSAIIVQLIWSVLASAGVEGTGSLAIASSTLLCCSLASVPQLLYLAINDKSYRLDLAVPLALGLVCFVPVGAKALVSLPEAALRMILGAVFLALSLYQLQLTLRSSVRAWRDARYQQFNAATKAAELESEPKSEPALPPVLPSDPKPDSASATALPSAAGAGAEIPDSAATPPAAAASDAASDHAAATSVAVADSDSKSDSEPVKLLSLRSRVLSSLRTRLFWIAFAVGCFAGFLGGSFGTWGPPVMLFYSYTSLTKEQIRGTNAVTSAISLPVNVISALVLGVFQSDAWPAYVEAPILVTIFTAIGVALQKRVDTPSVHLALQGLILLGSLSMSTPGDGSAYGWITLALYIIATGMFIAVITLKTLTTRANVHTAAASNAANKFKLSSAIELEAVRSDAPAVASPPPPPSQPEAGAPLIDASAGPASASDEVPSRGVVTTTPVRRSVTSPPDDSSEPAN